MYSSVTLGSIEWFLTVFYKLLKDVITHLVVQFIGVAVLEEKIQARISFWADFLWLQWAMHIV